jgi:hypothetical protein
VVGGDVRALAARQLLERVRGRTAQRGGLEHRAGLAASVVFVGDHRRDPRSPERQQRRRGIAGVVRGRARADGSHDGCKMIAHVVIESIRDCDGTQSGAEPDPLLTLRVQRRCDVVLDVGHGRADAARLVAGALGCARFVSLRERGRGHDRRGQRDGGV